MSLSALADYSRNILLQTCGVENVAPAVAVGIGSGQAATLEGGELRNMVLNCCNVLYVYHAVVADVADKRFVEINVNSVPKSKIWT